MAVPVPRKLQFGLRGLLTAISATAVCTAVWAAAARWNSSWLHVLAAAGLAAVVVGVARALGREGWGRRGVAFLMQALLLAGILLTRVLLLSVLGGFHFEMSELTVAVLHPAFLLASVLVLLALVANETVRRDDTTRRQRRSAASLAAVALATVYLVAQLHPLILMLNNL